MRRCWSWKSQILQTHEWSTTPLVPCPVSAVCVLPAAPGHHHGQQAPSLQGHPPAERGAAGPCVQGSVEPTPLTLLALCPPRDTQPLLQDGACSETGKPSWTRLRRGLGWEERAWDGVGAADTPLGAHGQWDTEAACPSSPSAQLLNTGPLLSWGCQDEAVWRCTGFYPFEAQHFLTYPRVCAEFSSAKAGNLLPM